MLKVTDLIPDNLLGQEREWVKTISPLDVSHLKHSPYVSRRQVLPTVYTSSPSLMMNGGLMNASGGDYR